MKYLLSFVVEEEGMGDASPGGMQESMRRWAAFDQEATDKGALIACEPLEKLDRHDHPPRGGRRTDRDGRTVRRVEGGPRRLLSARVREPRRGDRVGEQGPAAVRGIEIRAVMDLSQYGYESKTLTPPRGDRVKAVATPDGARVTDHCITGSHTRPRLYSRSRRSPIAARSVSATSAMWASLSYLRRGQKNPATRPCARAGRRGREGEGRSG